MLTIRSAVALLGLLVAEIAGAETITGRVVGVTDGDTLTLLDSANQQHKIRLAGIDAPEKRQAYGRRSTYSLSALAFGKQATADCPKRDRYGRSVCVVTVNGQDVGLDQIRAGMAWWYRKYAYEQTPEQRANYEQAEDEARARRLGLWADKSPIPPWEWRKAARAK